jgi:ATP/maltotriose-dependent transcriptional regulator MalT
MTTTKDQANQKVRDLVKHRAKVRTGDQIATCAFDPAMAACLASHAEVPIVAPLAEAAPLLQGLAASELIGASAFARQVRLAYGLLQTTIEEAAETVELNNAQITAEVEDLQSKALRSLHQSALATIELFEAMGAAHDPGAFAHRHVELARRQREAINGRLVDFLDSARSMVAMMTNPLNQQLRAMSGAMAGVASGPQKSAEAQKPSGSEESVLSRLNKLTARQKHVLELLAEGLPNKVIAHELGISETTVKAHVGEILRKLKVYNRARAIVMLAQFDMRQIRSLPATEPGDGE